MSSLRQLFIQIVLIQLLQRCVVLSFSSGASNARSGIAIQPLVEDDITEVSTLIVEGFDGDFSEFGGKMKKFWAIWNIEAQMEHRFGTFIERKSRPYHLMSVAKDLEGAVLGYVELGLVNHNADFNAKQDDRMIEGEAAFPHIGNLVVDPKFRRQGIAYALMTHAMEMALQWGKKEIFCAVELDNPAAYALYVDKLQFEDFRLETVGSNPNIKKDRMLLRRCISDVGGEKKIEDEDEDEGEGEGAKGVDASAE